jgi:hypothetical protein
MPVVSLDGLRFSDLAWALKLLTSEHTKTSTWHARPFAITTQTTAYGLLEGKGRITCQLQHCPSTLALLMCVSEGFSNRPVHSIHQLCVNHNIIIDGQGMQYIGGKKRCVQGFVGKPEGRSHLKDQTVDGRII